MIEIKPRADALGRKLQLEQPNLDAWVLLQKGERRGWFFKHYLMFYNPKRSRLVVLKATERLYESGTVGRAYSTADIDFNNEDGAEVERYKAPNPDEQAFARESRRVSALLGRNEGLLMQLGRRPLPRERVEIEAEADRLLFHPKPEPNKNWAQDLRALQALGARIEKYSETLV